MTMELLYLAFPVVSTLAIYLIAVAMRRRLNRRRQALQLARQDVMNTLVLREAATIAGEELKLSPGDISSAIRLIQVAEAQLEAPLTRRAQPARLRARMAALDAELARLAQQERLLGL